MQLPELEFIQDTGVKTPSIIKDAMELPASSPSFPMCYSLGSWAGKKPVLFRLWKMMGPQGKVQS